MTEPMTEPQESARPSDVVERARQAVDAWDRFAVWAPTRVPGVRVCLDLVRDLVAEVERLRGSRDDALAELVGLDGLLSERDARIAVLRTKLARMTERAEGAEVAWQDAETERDAARAALDRVRKAVIWADPKRMDGIPCVRNTRVPVDQITTLLAECTDAQIVKFYPTVRRTQVAVLRALAGEVEA